MGFSLRPLNTGSAGGQILPARPAHPFHLTEEYTVLDPDQTTTSNLLLGHIADEEHLFKSLRVMVSVAAFVCTVLSSLLGWIYLDGRAQQEATNKEFKIALAEHSRQIERTLTLMEVTLNVDREQQRSIDKLLGKIK